MPLLWMRRKDCWMPFKMREIQNLESEAFEKKKEMQKKAFIEKQADYRKNEYFRRKRDKQK